MGHVLALAGGTRSDHAVAPNHHEIALTRREKINRSEVRIGSFSTDPEPVLPAGPCPLRPESGLEAGLE
jgi:hypothetical protein